MRHYGLIMVLVGSMMYLSCNGQKGRHPKDSTIEEVEFVRGVDEKEHVESPSMYDDRYGTPIIEKEGNPKDGLVKDPKEDEILEFGDGVDTEYDSYGDYSSDY